MKKLFLSIVWVVMGSIYWGYVSAAELTTQTLLGTWKVEYANTQTDEYVDASEEWTFFSDGKLEVKKFLSFSPKPMTVTDKYKIEDGIIKGTWQGSYIPITIGTNEMLFKSTVVGFYKFKRK